jgi:VWFA-related protein
MRRHSMAFAMTLAGLAILPVQALSQGSGQQQAPNSLKVNSTEVLVDAVVVDHRNRLITDLTPKDFEVYEDGVPQEISSFRLVRGETEALPADEKGDRHTTPAESPGMETHNTIVVLLDYSTTQVQYAKTIQDAAIKFVEKDMRPNDLMAVLVLGTSLRVASNFTNDKGKLVAALKGADTISTIRLSERANPEADSGGPGSLDQATQKTLDSDLTAILRKLVVTMQAAVDRIQGLGVLAAIRGIAGAVSTIPGRKTLLMFSQGFVPGPSVELELQWVAAAANRSQLAIYCIESQGLETRALNGTLVPNGQRTGRTDLTGYGGETGFDRAQEQGQDIREGGLRELALATGGTLFRNSNDLSSGLDRIDHEMRTYYLLSYRSKNEDLDGKFRQIRVAVKGANLSVRARSGYYAIPAGYELLSPTEFQLTQEAAKLQPGAGKIPLYMRAGAFQYGKTGFRIPVAVEMPYTAIQFAAGNNKHSAELEILGIVRDSNGTMVQRFGNPMKMNLTDAEYNSLKVGTIYVGDQVDLDSPGAYRVQVLVEDMSSKAVSSTEQTVYLARAASSMALSTVLLAHGQQLYKATDTSDKFLTVQGLRITPSGACQFRSGENLIFYLDIYNAGLDPAKKKPNLTVALKLLHDGQETSARLPSFEVTDNPDGVDSSLTFCRFLRLTGLSPGDYTLVVDVKDAVGNQTASREAKFSIVG